MRLKIIFFPLVLIVSVTIIINYIWPQLQRVKQLSGENASKRSELAAISSKQDSINGISSKITADVEGDSLVKKYLPQSKPEEQIISSVNFLANDANVVISNISLIEGASSSELQAPVDPALTAAADAGVAADGTADLQTNPATGQTVKINALKTVSTKISVIGDYTKIKIFLDGLNHMPLVNSIGSLEIKKQEAKDQPTDQSQPAPADNVNLSADVVVNFGYMDQAKIGMTSVANFKSELDTETIGVLKKYVLQKSQFVSNESEAKGRPNPFTAN